MPKVSKEQVKRETEIIRHLFYDEGYDEQQILDQLKIDRVTLYRYFKRIHRQYARLWNPDSSLVKARLVQLQMELEQGLKLNAKLRDDDTRDPRVRQEASQLAATFAAHLVKLAKEGPTILLLPQVKHIIEERKPLEYKQI